MHFFSWRFKGLTLSLINSLYARVPQRYAGFVDILYTNNKFFNSQFLEQYNHVIYYMHMLITMR